ncbi:hypothetical protein VTJ49DRAFT_1975 [Mycothermus thermophilus]|uniref:Uncharacterized protein n=1 Tax=Humicola insolens TaxID=85995 RepID=A0ABR3VNZ7_HUMIN
MQPQPAPNGPQGTSTDDAHGPTSPPDLQLISCSPGSAMSPQWGTDERHPPNRTKVMEVMCLEVRGW